MSTWIKNHKSKYKTVYTAAIENFNKFSPKRLKALREGGDPHNKNFPTKMTQRDMAELIDVSYANYNKIERGRIEGHNNVTVEQAIKISTVFGCTIDYLLLGQEPEKITTRVTEVPKDTSKYIEALEGQVDALKKANELLASENKRLSTKSKR